MKCPDCNGINCVRFHSEEIICTHCDESNVIVAYVCKDCGGFWRTVNGIMDDNFRVSGESTLNIFKSMADSVGLTVEEPEIFMDSFVHRCIKCNSIVHEVSNNKYVCPSCGFSWNITDILED